MKPDAYYKNGEDLYFSPTSHQEERELFSKAKAGDAVAKEKIIHNHLLLVANIARRFAKGRLPEDEITSAANYALMKAFENFNPEFPNRFAAFLNVHVRGEIARLWSDKNLVSKPDFSDGVAVVSVPVDDDSGLEDGADAQEEKEFLIKLSEKAKEVLDPREREIVDMLFCETPTNQSEVARKLKISRERVRQLFNVALQKLQKRMRELMNETHTNQ